MGTRTRPGPESVFFPALIAPAGQATAATARSEVGGHIGHKSAAALIQEGALRMALQEERLTRIKNQGGHPIDAMRTITGARESASSLQRLVRLALCRRNPS